MHKVLLADSLDKEAIKNLESSGEFEVTVRTGMSMEELIRVIPDYEAVVVRSASKLPCQVLEHGKNLKIVIRAGIGLDNVDCNTAGQLGIEVRNTPSATTISVAEETFGLMLAAVRNICQADISMKQHKWEKKAFAGTEVYGKTLGIIGYGRIGKEVARRAIAFGMRVIAYDIIPIDSELDVTQVTLEELYRSADIITLHLPKTSESTYLLSRDEFRKMKDSVILINASRGGIVDEKALLESLESGKVRAAALDVFEKEPPEDFSLVDHPNVIATPHLGASAKEGQERAGHEVVRILKERFSCKHG